MMQVIDKGLVSCLCPANECDHYKKWNPAIVWGPQRFDQPDGEKPLSMKSVMVIKAAMWYKFQQIVHVQRFANWDCGFMAERITSPFANDDPRIPKHG